MAIPQIWIRERIEAATDCEAFPLSAPEGQAPPYAIYERQSTEREVLLSEGNASPATGSSVPPVAEILIQVYADDYVDVWTRSTQIVGAVHGFAGGSIVTSIVTDERDGTPEFLEGRDRPTYVVELTVRIWYEPT